MTHLLHQARDGLNRTPEPFGFSGRLIYMNPSRWAAVTAVAVLVVVLAVFVSVSLLSNDGPATGPSAPGARLSFAFDAAYADADPLVVVVRYGDSGACPGQAGRHGVVEPPGRAGGWRVEAGTALLGPAATSVQSVGAAGSEGRFGGTKWGVSAGPE